MVARAGSGRGASDAPASGSGDPAQTPEVAPPLTRAERAETRWVGIVRHFQRLRRLQRLWGQLGNHIQTYPAELRDRLREVDPPEPRRR